MNVLITGGSGFIGTNLVSYYRDLGVNILNIDIRSPRNPEHISFWKRVDINDLGQLSDAVTNFNPDFCFHLAARTDLQGVEIDDYSANIVGVQNVVSVLRLCENLKLAVFASSMLVCKIGFVPEGEDDYCPSTVYGISKARGEEIVRESAADKFPWIIVRPTSIWGPWFSAPYKDFFMAIRRGLYLHPSNCRVKRSYGFVLNTVSQLVQLQVSRGGGLVGETVYLADYDPIELGSWADLIQSSMNARPIRRLPLPFFRSMALVGDFLKLIGYQKFPMSSFRLNNMLTESVVDVSPLNKLTGVLPYSPSDGVRITCDWLRCR